MKRITAIAITIAAVLGSCYVGTAGAAVPAPKVNPDTAYSFCLTHAKNEVGNDQSQVYPLVAACMQGYSKFLYGVQPKDIKVQTDNMIEGASHADKKTFYAMASFVLTGYGVAFLGENGMAE
ncbi:MAG: hypothetical protein [Bacteriophage sp.]|nr:MAG: hypothetical protein [Bacteriophage sp.]